MQKMSSPLRLSIASSRLSFASGQRVKPRLLRPYLVPGQIRLFNESTAEESPRTLPPRRNIPSFILTALVTFGGGMVFYSAYKTYKVVTMWPLNVRKDLQKGLLAKAKGKFDLSVLYLRQAWDITKSTPVEAFKKFPYLKISGVGLALANSLELAGKIDEAYVVYEDVLIHMQAAHVRAPLTGLESMRAVAIAYRLGHLAHSMEKSKEEEEKWLVYAVQTLLTDIMSAPVAAELVQTGDSETQVMISDLRLPKWATKHDLAAPFEALASFYSHNGQIEYAMPLYLQAITILIPPLPQVSSPDDKCRGAQLMGNIAELIVRNPSPENIQQAESWAKKGLDVVKATRNDTHVKYEICEAAYAVMLYNLAMTRELSGDIEKVQDMLTESLDHSETIGFNDGIKQAEEALKKVKETVDIPSDNSQT